MKKPDQLLLNILKAREDRAELRKNIAKSGYYSLSLSLNIPGYPKSNKLLSHFFSSVLEDLFIYLQANRISIISKEQLLKKDDTGDFFLVPLSGNKHIDIYEIKQLTEIFEEKHKLGRLIDLDIFDKEGNPVSSGKEKPCYFCGDYAAVSCMRNKRHSYSEIRNKIFEDITTFLESNHKEKLIQKIGSLAQRALLYEISISNKPGLVCFEDSGVHKDMSFFTFLNSASALSPFLKEFCALGYHYNGSLDNVLPKIREIGLRAENSMYQATGNVNTHKGIIFLFGISLFSITRILSKNKSFTDIYFQETVKKIGKDLIEKELFNTTEPKTHGEKVYKQHGVTGAGIRQEIETGLATIFQTTIPYLSDHLHPEIYKDQTKIQKVLLHGLLQIMAVNNDSNILYRSDLQSLNFIKRKAKIALTDTRTYEELCAFCKLNKISPGGSADLLAVSLLIHFIKSEDHEF